MALMQFGMEVNKFFFDRAAVLKAIGKANAKALSKAGAFIRRRAITSLRRRKSISQPGSPPSVHSTDSVATLKNILFFYDSSTERLVVGPVGLNQRKQSWITMGSITVPQLHEFGDVVVIQEVSRDKGRTWSRSGSPARSRNAETIFRQRRITYKPRPFMSPSLTAEMENIPKAWQGSMSQ